MEKTSQFTSNISLEELVKDKEMLKKFLAALYAMHYYEEWTIFYDVNRIERNFSAQSPYHLSKLNFDYKERVSRMKEAIALNQKFLNEIIKKYDPPDSFYKEQNIDMEEIYSLSKEPYDFLPYAIFLYIVRDWTPDCKKEREIHYKPIIDEVKKYFPEPKDKKILIPGAALCRLGYELAGNGYDIDLNEFLPINVMFADYLFKYSKKEMFSFQPLIRSFCNYLTEDAIFKKFSFPDVDINLENKGKMNLIWGDFTTIFNDKAETYDCILTCFFIDTAKIIFQYIDIIHKLLKKGGIWINFGPLSYHWVSYDEIPSIELPYDKLKEVIINYGFEYLFENTKIPVCYCEIENFMKNEYFDCVFFTARKK